MNPWAACVGVLCSNRPLASESALPPALLLVSSGQVRSTGAALGDGKPIHFDGCSFSTLRQIRAPQACVPGLKRVCVAWGARGRARSCGRSPWRASPPAPTASTCTVQGGVRVSGGVAPRLLEHALRIIGRIRRVLATGGSLPCRTMRSRPARGRARHRPRRDTKSTRSRRGLLGGLAYAFAVSLALVGLPKLSGTAGSQTPFARPSPNMPTHLARVGAASDSGVTAQFAGTCRLAAGELADRYFHWCLLVKVQNLSDAEINYVSFAVFLAPHDEFQKYPLLQHLGPGAAQYTFRDLRLGTGAFSVLQVRGVTGAKLNVSHVSIEDVRWSAQ
jgi:hypothetical protein